MPFEEEIKAAEDFHGHLCFGLSVGIVASKFAMDKMGINKTTDESSFFVIAENNSCAVDAIQILCGVTLGKGNLVINDLGKHVYIFGDRKTGRALRISLKHGVFKGIKNREEKIEKIMSGNDVFDIREIEIQPPPEAEVARSIQCELCKEPVMKTRTKVKGNKRLCLPCYEKVYIESSE
jgi:formylmethanofuran dehydrogenase subunit E